MVENAANFTSTYGNRPSIFEIVAQKSLNDTLHPALQKIALVLSTNVPQKLCWLNDYFEESYLCLNGLLQYYYLTYYDASFSENFYGLKRVLANNSKLSQHHREYSLILLVVLPYFKRKIDEKVALIRIEQAEGCVRNDIEGKFKKALLFSHSSFEILWSLLTIHNYLQYMANHSEFQTPILKLLDVKLTYDMEQLDYPSFWMSLFKGSLSLSQLSFGLIRNAVATSLEVGAFFLQFLHAWNTQKSNYNVTDLPNVTVPILDSKAKNHQGKCPICLKSWIIPTVLQVSGYIFCFRCILRFLNENQKCPVTNLPARTLDIVRLYIN